MQNVIFNKVDGTKDNSISGNIFTFKEDSNSFDDKKIIQDTRSSASFSEIAGVKKYPNDSDIIIDNIRFSPKIIEFVNAYEGKQFAEKFTIQNIGKKPAHIKIGEPNSFMFQLKKSNQRPKLLPSGCAFTKTITYTYHSDDLVSKSQLPVLINGNIFALPIVVKSAKPEIEVNPQKLNFEVINLGSPAKSMMLTIVNTGGKRTKFEIDCGMNLDLVVSPMRGTLKPKHPVTVRVEVMQFKEGEYYRELWIKTTEVPIRVPVLVEVVNPRLEVTYPIKTKNFTLIHFQPTFKGAQRMQYYILKNVSVENTMFVTLAEIDGELQVLKTAKKTSEAFKMFVVTAEEGLLGPFENRICNVLFRPKAKKIKKGWHHIEEEKKSTQHNQVVFLRINSVHAIELKEIARANQMTNNPEGKTSSTTVNEIEERSALDFKATDLNFLTHRGDSEDIQEEQKALRLCMHGEAIDPDILVQPFSLEFGDLVLGQTESRVIRITNKSIIPVKCKFLKKLNVKTRPEEFWLKSEKSIEILVRLTPTVPGNIKTKIIIQLLAESDVYYSTDEPLVAVGTYPVLLTYSARNSSTILQPKTVLGITPFVTDEVGFQKELITFKDAFKFPYAAMLGLKHGFKPVWMREEEDKVKNVDNATIALPNDRPRFFYSWPKDKVCRTIFKGFFRYSPPEDLAYTLSPQGVIEKKERRAIWENYISRRLKQENHPSLKELECLDNKMLNQISPKIMFNLDYQVKRDWQNERIPKLTFVPLSPMFLYRIEVQPTLINFNKVAVNTTKQETITIHNTNTFPISIKFSSRDSDVWLSVTETQTVLPQTVNYTDVFLHAKESGQYYGFLNYVINGSHEFKIPISALALPKTLILHDKILEFGENSPLRIFRPRSLFISVENVVHCPVGYNMIFSEESAYTTEITRGEVPPKSRVFIEILMTMAADKCLFSDVTLVSESGKADTVKLRYELKSLPVNFLEEQIDLGDVPLNLTTVAQPVVHNACYNDVFFEVLNLNPIPGVTVEPAKGLLRARSFYQFRVVIKIPVIMKFSFTIEMSANVCKRLSCQITGNVVFPKISIKPSALKMRKICEYSFDRITAYLTNEGKTPAEIELNFVDSPEFTVEGPTMIRLHAKGTEKFVIRFNPKRISRYNFYLPLIINGILGPPIMQNSETEVASYFISHFESNYQGCGDVQRSAESTLKIPCVYIYCSVCKSPLRILPASVYFRKKNKSKFQPQTIQIINVTAEDVVFCIRDDDIGDIHESPFNLEIVQDSPVEYRKRAIKIQLSPGEKLLLMASFQPKKPGSYEIEIPVFIRRPDEEVLYSYIRLKGKMETSHIYPMSSEVYFSPLPLGVACETILTIWAENYKAPDTINCQIWDPKEGITDCHQLTIIWLDEPNISECFKNIFKLKIIFQSSVPIAFRKYIILFDSLGTYATVLVTAVADNSAVTTHAFLSTQECKYEIIRSTKSKSKTNLEKKISENSTKGNENEKNKSNVEVPEISKTQMKSDEEMLKKEPKLVIKKNKMMTEITDLNVVNLIKIQCKENKPIVEKETKTLSGSNKLESEGTLQSVNESAVKSEIPESLTFPNFPKREEPHWEYFQSTVNYVEKWIFEMVMNCGQYFSIPRSFQRLMQPKQKEKLDDKNNKPEEKDFLYFLKEVLGDEVKLPKRPVFSHHCTQQEKMKPLYSFFDQVLNFLQDRGCLLPHIRPEYLMGYEDYLGYLDISKGVETFLWERSDILKGSRSMNSEEVRIQTQTNKPEKADVGAVYSWNYKDFFQKSFNEIDDVPLNMEDCQDTIDQGHESAQNLSMSRQAELKMEVLDKVSFELRSTQAWLDIVIQIFRVFVLGKIVKRNDSLQQTFHGASDNLVEKQLQLQINTFSFKKGKDAPHTLSNGEMGSPASNIYSLQERILLDWLNRKSGCPNKILNDFKNDLSDSVALISLTSFYCPYIVNDYFKDVFENPDTPSKKHHNASRLVQAWRTLKLGFTVNTRDIMRPNVVFMLMLLTHLYHNLPSLYPSSHLCFCAPLNSVFSKVIELKNDTQHSLVYEAKFFGETENFFTLNETFPMEIKKSESGKLTIDFSSRHIRKISATLFLCGVVRSPHFGRHIVFNLEGEPTELKESEKLTFSAPLYKVICSEIRIKSPYLEPATYDIWYTTRKPEYTGEPNSYFKPWSSIRSRKVSRRLFLESAEVNMTEGNEAPLRVTTACLTASKRNFWLLFKSTIGVFIILIEISPKMTSAQTTVTSFYPKAWGTSSCTCPQKNSPKLNNVNCPCLTVLRIPKRNEAMWNALRKMFFRTLQKQENPFWEEYFEKNIGICLILWLLDSEEEEEVLDEFVTVLPSKVTYKLSVEPKNHIIFPKTFEISDVRENSEIAVPIHISSEAPPVLNFLLTMTSENTQEVRTLRVEFRKNELENSESQVSFLSKGCPRINEKCRKC